MWRLCVYDSRGDGEATAMYSIGKGNGADAIGPGEEWRERKNPQERKCMREERQEKRPQPKAKGEKTREELSVKCCPAGQRPCIIICPWHSSDETGSLVEKEMKNVITFNSFKGCIWPASLYFG